MHQVNGSRRRARDVKFDQLSGMSCHGDCQSPVEIFYRGAPDKIMVGLGLEKDQISTVRIYGRCRQCDNCLMHRRRLWTARAVDECALATRNWFGTLTVRPEERFRFVYAAQLRKKRACVSWDELATPEQFQEICAEIKPEITKFLKRVRKNADTSFRYLLVTEAHEDGFPHFHMLMHEVEGPIRKRQLDAAWRSGFSQWRLLPVGDPKGARYACKYLSKSALTRVRASQRYGLEGRKVRGLAERLGDASLTVSNFIGGSKGTGPSE